MLRGVEGRPRRQTFVWNRREREIVVVNLQVLGLASCLPPEVIYEQKRGECCESASLEIRRIINIQARFSISIIHSKFLVYQTYGVLAESVVLKGTIVDLEGGQIQIDFHQRVRETPLSHSAGSPLSRTVEYYDRASSYSSRRTFLHSQEIPIMMRRRCWTVCFRAGGLASYRHRVLPDVPLTSLRLFSHVPRNFDYGFVAATERAQ